ncbi:MAG TPA: Rid family detoxifying hydrolase [Nitrososphaerales archaeon]|nr:Rid family detoxifying hydrolase [Nitrososphaerales archaeon]
MKGGARPVHTKEAPEPGGHYSQAVVAGNIVYVAGSGPFNPSTHRISGSTIEEQTERTLENVSLILQAAGSSADHVVKVTVYLKDMNDFKRMDAAYAKFFGQSKPARTTVQAGLYGEGRLIVVDAVAVIP